MSLRVFAGFFLIVGLAAFFVLRIFMEEVKPGVRQGMEVALVDTAHLLAELAEPEMQQGRLAEGPFAQAVERYAQRGPKALIWGMEKRRAEFRVYVTDEKGIVVFDSNHQAEGQDYSRWNNVWRTLQGQYGARSSRSVATDESSSHMHVSAPILTKGRLIGVLTVATPTSTVMPYVQRSQRRVKLAGLVLMGTALATGVLLSWWLTRSLGRLRRYARDTAEGHKAARPILGSGELDELGRAMEGMREKLEGRKYLERHVQALAHEMRSPLAAIHGAAELLDGPLPEADRSHFVSNIREQEMRLQRLVERMMGLASLQQRQALEAVTEVSLAELLRETVASKATRALQADVHFTLDEEPVRVWGEAFLL
ncbi:MAG: two-component system sensor histidine kinase CreC, partial [Firmicutes bacterium]|nr:two-component system sensor histidine kinase CreC [Bacillota bacterium]